MSDAHTGRARKRVSGGPGKGVNRWARKLRQNTLGLICAQFRRVDSGRFWSIGLSQPHGAVEMAHWPALTFSVRGRWCMPLPFKLALPFLSL